MSKQRKYSYNAIATRPYTLFIRALEEYYKVAQV
jgi:hypothetical protein